jgi:hypothetical protein
LLEVLALNGLIDSTLFRPLARRPQATTVTVKELIRKVCAGEIRVPQFQRPLRWKGEDVQRLMDSLWRGYPVGSLLFWKRRAAAERIRLGGAWIDAPTVADAWWVVDGQQRTTALAAALLDLDHAGDARWTLRFDPERAQFLEGAPPPDRVGRDIPLSVLGDLRRLGRWIREEGQLEEEEVDRVEEAQQHLLDYSVPAYIVDTDDEPSLRAIFARLNSTGTRMRDDEVFQALLGAPTGNAPSLDLDALQSNCDLEGFGLPPRAELLKAVLAMSGRDPTRRVAQSDLSGLVSREAAGEALTRAIAFLQKDCLIPHVRLIPYPVVFVILARWFHVHPSPDPATRALLARWVWRGALTGTHQRAEVSRMRQQVRDIREGDEQGSLDRLMSRVGLPPPMSVWELETFNHNSARSRIEMLALLALGPRHPLGHISLRALGSGERIAREIYIKRFAVGHDLPGAVEVSGDADEDESSIPEPVPEGRLCFSLAGMQLKLSMLRSDDRFALPARGQTGRWIVKIGGERLPELVEVEDATMAWAGRAGFSVPRHQVLPAEALIGVDRTLIGQAPGVFVIERFDRQPEGSRVHQEDFAQALEIGASHKYGDTGPRRTSYDRLARLVRDASGPEAQGDFIERVAFVVASGNDDAHLKNWSFQWGRDHRPRLAPCYDLVSTISWPEFGWQRTGGLSLALALGRSRRFANLDLEQLERFVERAEAADGRARFLSALERARAAWPLVADSAPQRMREAVAEHWRTVPLLRYVGLVPRSTRP